MPRDKRIIDINFGVGIFEITLCFSLRKELKERRERMRTCPLICVHNFKYNDRSWSQQLALLPWIISKRKNLAFLCVEIKIVGCPPYVLDQRKMYWSKRTGQSIQARPTSYQEERILLKKKSFRGCMAWHIIHFPVSFKAIPSWHNVNSRFPGRRVSISSAAIFHSN